MLEKTFIKIVNKVKQLRYKLQKLGFILGLSLLLLQAYNGLRSIQFKNFGPSSLLFLGLCVLIIIFTLILQIGVWLLIFRGLGVTLNIPSAASGYFITFIARYIPGTIWGYISRAEWLEREERIPIRLSNLCSVVEIIAAVLSSVIAASFLIVRFVSVPLLRPILILIFLISPIPVWYLFQFLANSRLQEKYTTLLSWAKDLSLLNLWTWLRSVYILVINWLLQGIVIFLVQKAIFLNFDELNFSVTLQNAGSSAFSWLIGFFILIIPTGMGVRELSLSELLSSTRGLALSEATAIAIITRFILILAELLCVAVAVIFRSYRKHKRHSLDHLVI